MRNNALLGRLFRPGLLGNIGANGLGQIVQIVIQLLSVPIYAHSLGLERYGVWLIFITLPAYLSVSDFGLTIASGNDMTARVANGDHIGARTTYRTMRRTMLYVTLGIAAIAAFLLLVAFPNALDFARAASDGYPLLVVAGVLTYGLASLNCSATFAAFRATGEYSVAAYRMQWISLVEALAAIAAAWAGYGLIAMAMAYAGVRLAGSTWLWILLRRRSPLFFIGPSDSITERGKAMLAPAIAAVALPVANMIVLHGTVALIGAIAGPAAVPAFTATRTVTRLPVQFVQIINLASLPGFTASHATGDRQRMADLITLTLIAIVTILLVAGGLIALFGTTIVTLWTNGTIHAPAPMVFAMVISMLALGCWAPLSNFLLAINRQASFSYAYLALVIVSLIAASQILHDQGAIGVAIVTAVVDLLMLALLIRQSSRHGIIDMTILRSAPKRGMYMIRALLKKD